MGFIAKRTNDLNWGFWVMNKVQMAVNLFILGGVYEFPIYLTLLLIPIAFGIMLLVGWIFNKYLRENYLKEQFKGIIR